jgi:hypothetical protein
MSAEQKLREAIETAIGEARNQDAMRLMKSSGHVQLSDDEYVEILLAAVKPFLSAHPDTGKEDGERLDWLEKNAVRVEAMDHFKEQSLKKWFVFTGHKTPENMMNTVRAAIDAVRAAQSAPNEGRKSQ